MIGGIRQRHFCNAIVADLERRGGKADCREVIYTLAGPSWFDITPEERGEADSWGSKFDHACHAARQWLTENGYIEKVKVRGIWVRTQKPYNPIVE